MNRTNRRFLLFTLVIAGASALLLAIYSRSSLEQKPVSTPPANISVVSPDASSAAMQSSFDRPSATLDANLLFAQNVAFHCDASEEGALVCDDNAPSYRLEANVSASTYARWSMQLPEDGLELRERDVLALDVRVKGTLLPNLYFVEEDGRRILQRLPTSTHSSDTPGATTVYFPLSEIRNEDNIPLNPGALREVQIVFEWADMEGVLEIEAVRFLTSWEEVIDTPLRAEEIVAPAGFVVEPIAADILSVTQFQVVAEDTLLVSQQNGRIWWYRDLDGDGFYESRQLYASGFDEVVGLLYDPIDGAVWVGGRGNLWRTLDEDGNGVADLIELRVEGMAWGRHQNNGLIWNPVADPFTGEPPYTWIYFGLGSTGDLEEGDELNATILRFHRNGHGKEALEIVANGVRNAYGLLWAPVLHDGETHWSLFAGENGPDFNAAPDEVNHIRWGLHYGFPEHFGMVDPQNEGDPYSSPVLEVTAHASANSLAYVTNSAWPEEYRTLYVSLFGSVFSAEPVKPAVDRIILTTIDAPDGLTFRGEATLFLDNLSRPLPIATDHNGDLLVGDYGSGVIYRVRYLE